MNIFAIEEHNLDIWYPCTNPIRFFSDHAFYASTLELAEQWMLDQNPSDRERYYYTLSMRSVDEPLSINLLGYYNMCGEKSTKQRCLAIAEPR